MKLKDRIVTEGMKLATDPRVAKLMQDERFMRLVMTAIGVNPDSVTYVPIGPPAARGAALIAGQIDATTMSVGAFLSLTDRANIHVLVPVEEYLLHAHVLNKVNVVPDAVLTGIR